LHAHAAHFLLQVDGREEREGGRCLPTGFEFGGEVDDGGGVGFDADVTVMNESNTLLPSILFHYQRIGIFAEHGKTVVSCIKNELGEHRNTTIPVGITSNFTKRKIRNVVQLLDETEYTQRLPTYYVQVPQPKHNTTIIWHTNNPPHRSSHTSHSISTRQSTKKRTINSMIVNSFTYADSVFVS
jgi:hypothetical protein